MTQRRMGSFFASLSRLYQASCLLRLRMTSPAKPSRLREAVAVRNQIRRHGSLMKYSNHFFPTDNSLTKRM